MKVSTENDNNFGYEKITILVDNIPLTFTLVIPKQRGCTGCIASGLSSLPAYQYQSFCVSIHNICSKSIKKAMLCPLGYTGIWKDKNVNMSLTSEFKN
jgi:hypothetical protein